MPEMIDASGGSTAGSFDITGLATFTSYDFTISTRYSGLRVEQIAWSPREHLAQIALTGMAIP